ALRQQAIQHRLVQLLRHSLAPCDLRRLLAKSSYTVQITDSKKDGSGGVDITINMSKAIRSSENGTINVLARTVAHEGQHGVDDQARGSPVMTRDERFAAEVSGYTAQAIYQKAAGFAESSSDGWTPFGGFSQKNIERQANISVLVACGSSTEGSCK
ncbi:hypothetical protein, partial [Tahibacter caeni]|uniref:hypothetical protein n=1 Tax=Tahibacter caeni TaxID=1453545 RepID=UPI0021482213